MTSALLCVPYQSDFFLNIADQYREQAAFSSSRVTRYGEFNFGADLSRKEAFLCKNALIGAQVHLLQSVLAKTKSSWTIAVEHHSVQKLRSSAITLLPIFIAGPW